MKKLFIFLSFLCSCCRNEAWKYQQVITDCKEFNSANLTYYSPNRFTGIDVQFLTGEFGILCFLNVLSREIPPLPDDPKCALVVIEINDQQTPFKAVRMEGGQRLLLSPEATALLVSAFNSGLNVNIYLNGFMAQVTCDKFPIYYNKFQKMSL